MNQNVRTSDAVSFTSITETSALKYKENIETLDSGDLIYNLRPVTFDWKSIRRKRLWFNC
jgi:putative ubiquitin-RnfH superfamily antitoxin RatB of RatAB toxin-antitoxin module